MLRKILTDWFGEDWIEKHWVNLSFILNLLDDSPVKDAMMITGIFITYDDTEFHIEKTTMPVINDEFVTVVSNGKLVRIYPNSYVDLGKVTEFGVEWIKRIFMGDEDGY